MKLEALIFDVDGTLADTEEVHRLSFNAAFKRLELGWHWDRTEYRRLLRTAGGKERLAAFIDERLAGDAARESMLARVPEIHAEKTRLFGAAMRAGAVAARPGVFSLLSESRAAGLRMAIASTTSPQNVHALLESVFGWRKELSFDVIACGDAVPHKKPAPDIYVLALEKLGVAPGAAIAFEDSELGLRSANAAGVWTVITPTFWTSGDDFGAAGLVRTSLNGLTLAELSQLRGEA